MPYKEGENMKKIVSFLAVAAVLGGSIMGTVGCSFGGGGGKEVKALKGTTGAKIALARERLDESGITGPLYLRCDAGNPGEIYDLIEISVLSS